MPITPHAGKRKVSITGLGRVIRAVPRRGGGHAPPPWLAFIGIVTGLAVVLPLLYLIIRTVGAGAEVLDLILRARLLTVLVNTVVFMVVVALGSVVIAVPVAFLTLRTDMPFRRFMAVATLIPLVVPSYVAGYVAVVALGPRGMLQQALEPLGVERLPEIYGLPGAAFVLTFISYPYVLLSVRAALIRMDPAMEEAARALGRNALQTFIGVTLPLLRPAVAAGALLVALYVLSEFGAVSLLRFETFTLAIYVQYESAFNPAAASSLALVLGVMALGIVWVESSTRGRARYYRSSGGVTRPPSLVRLGRWRWPALALVCLPVLIGLVAPIGVLGYWLARGVANGESLDFLGAATRNSLWMAALAGGVTVLLAAPVALLAVRYPSRLSALLERMTYLGFALPGIVVALALVFVGANVAPAVYQTQPLLLFAYVLLFISVGVGALRTSLLQVSPHLEEAARSLGLSSWRAMLRVTLPLVLPGALAGGAMVFLLTMKELPATLILGPAGFDTLATAVWSTVSEAFFARAAVPALLLIVVTGPPTAYLVLREHHRRRADANLPTVEAVP